MSPKQSEASKKTQKTNQLPSAFTLFKPSLDAFVFNIGTLLEIVVTPIIVGLLALIPGVIGWHGHIAMRGVWLGLAGVLGITALVLWLIVAACLPYIQIKSARGEEVGYKEAFDVGKHFALRMIGLGICVAAIYLVSFLLLVVPFFFMLRRYYLASYYMIDQDLGVFETLRQSAAQSKQFSSAVWGLIGVNFLLGLLGVIPLIGWVVGTILQTLYLFAPAVRYVQIQVAARGKHKAHHESVEAGAITPA